MYLFYISCVYIFCSVVRGIFFATFSYTIFLQCCLFCKILLCYVCSVLNLASFLIFKCITFFSVVNRKSFLHFKCITFFSVVSVYLVCNILHVGIFIRQTQTYRPIHLQKLVAFLFVHLLFYFSLKCVVFGEY